MAFDGERLRKNPGYYGSFPLKQKFWNFWNGKKS